MNRTIRYQWYIDPECPFPNPSPSLGLFFKGKLVSPLALSEARHIEETEDKLYPDEPKFFGLNGEALK